MELGSPASFSLGGPALLPFFRNFFGHVFPVMAMSFVEAVTDVSGRWKRNQLFHNRKPPIAAMQQGTMP